MDAKREIDELYNFYELGIPEKNESKYNIIGGKRFKKWEYLSNKEKDEQRAKFYREELERWQREFGVPYFEEDSFVNSGYAFEDDYEKGSVYWRFIVKDNAISNKFKFFKLRYIAERNYVDWVYFKLENEICLLEDRKNTVLKKKEYIRKDGKRGAYVERRFWKPCKDSSGLCEVFLTYGRNKRYDLIENNSFVLKVENKKSAVLKVLKLVYTHFYDTVAYDLEKLYINRLKDRLESKIKSSYKFYNRFYCLQGERIYNAQDLLHYKKRMDLLESTYNSHLFILMSDIRYNGQFEWLEDIKWDESQKAWKMIRVREEFKKPKFRRLKSYPSDIFERDKIESVRSFNVNSELSEEDLNELFEDM